MSRLPIEDYPELLLEYGRAFAWINITEDHLNSILIVKAGLGKANGKTVTQILDDMMIGKKIRLASDYLPKDIEKRLWQLNDCRLLLAHGTTGEEAPADNPLLKTGKLTIQHKHKKCDFSKTFLNETITLSKQISEELHQEIIKVISSKK